MKKIIFFAATVAVTMFASMQNVNAQKGIHLGVEGSPQMSWQMNKDDDKNPQFQYMNTVSSSYGINLGIGITNNFGLGVSGLYSFQGQRYKIYEIERSKRTEYVKIPLLLIFNANLDPNVMFIVKVGPQLGLLTNAKLVNKEGNEIITNQKKAYMKYDVGALITAGFGFNLADNWYLDTSLRFDCAFTDAEDKDYNTLINDPTAVPLNNGHVIYNSGRAVTNNVTTGLTIGIRYVFPMADMK